ncbi:hypothetical protein T492DRAFT_949531 [Pavlovales sp. CCMP2436]|nr:hypothetical protein T492DRAFT_949531 [Pavlovales sp. CCMP2436]
MLYYALFINDYLFMSIGGAASDSPRGSPGRCCIVYYVLRIIFYMLYVICYI